MLLVLAGLWLMLSAGNIARVFPPFLFPLINRYLHCDFSPLMLALFRLLCLLFAIPSSFPFPLYLILLGLFWHFFIFFIFPSSSYSIFFPKTPPLTIFFLLPLSSYLFHDSSYIISFRHLILLSSPLPHPPLLLLFFPIDSPPPPPFFSSPSAPLHPRPFTLSSSLILIICSAEAPNCAWTRSQAAGSQAPVQPRDQ